MIEPCRVAFYWYPLAKRAQVGKCGLSSGELFENGDVRSPHDRACDRREGGGLGEFAELSPAAGSPRSRSGAQAAQIADLAHDASARSIAARRSGARNDPAHSPRLGAFLHPPRVRAPNAEVLRSRGIGLGKADDGRTREVRP